VRSGAVAFTQVCKIVEVVLLDRTLAIGAEHLLEEDENVADRHDELRFFHPNHPTTR
jgi:hypothetical protein